MKYIKPLLIALTMFLVVFIVISVVLFAPPHVGHGPVLPRHQPNGLLKRAPHNQISTNNWSGYAVGSFQTGATYSAAAGTFQVPGTTYADYNGAQTNWEYASWWVGIGGFCLDAGCSSVDNTLIQLGVANQVATGWGSFYYPWYEMIPAGPVRIPYNVQAGDVITASLRCTDGCVPGMTQTWALAMSDQTAGWSWMANFAYPSSMNAAEWITEAPYGGGVEPLADYTHVTFEPVTANDVNPNLTLTANGVVMEDPWGQTSNPSGPLKGDWFSTCWGSGSLTPCTTTPIGSGPTPPPPPPPPPPPTPVPTVMLTATPSTILFTGGHSTLAWNSTNATSCTSGGFDTGGATAGSAVVSPTDSTDYSITCTGLGGSATADATIRVRGFFRF